MTKLILVTALWLAFACKPEMTDMSKANISSLEIPSCWTEKEAIEQLETLRKKVAQGEDFAALARKYS